jgi:hypothetical protein
MKKKMIRNALIISALLLIPLILTIRDGNIHGVGWNWSAGDFLFGFIIPFTAALIFEVIALRLSKGSHQFILGVVIALGVCALWVEMATGGISRTISSLLG